MSIIKVKDDGSGDGEDRKKKTIVDVKLMVKIIKMMMIAIFTAVIFRVMRKG